MRLTDSRWLTDENIHPEVVVHLRSRGLDVVDVKEEGWQGRPDEEILDIAYQSGRIILTHDGDFGTMALLGGRQVVGIVRRLALILARNPSSIRTGSRLTGTWGC